MEHSLDTVLEVLTNCAIHQRMLVMTYSGVRRVVIPTSVKQTRAGEKVLFADEVLRDGMPTKRKIKCFHLDRIADAVMSDRRYNAENITRSASKAERVS